MRAAELRKPDNRSAPAGSNSYVRGRSQHKKGQNKKADQNLRTRPKPAYCWLPARRMFVRQTVQSTKPCYSMEHHRPMRRRSPIRLSMHAGATMASMEWICALNECCAETECKSCKERPPSSTAARCGSVESSMTNSPPLAMLSFDAGGARHPAVGCDGRPDRRLFTHAWRLLHKFLSFDDLHESWSEDWLESRKYVAWGGLGCVC